MWHKLPYSICNKNLFKNNKKEKKAKGQAQTLTLQELIKLFFLNKMLLHLSNSSLK
jgi:hypothetical protein